MRIEKKLRKKCPKILSKSLQTIFTICWQGTLYCEDGIRQQHVTS